MSSKKTAHARHILVKEEQACLDLINRIQAGEEFAALAKEHSLCPSGKQGGDLGSFTQGMMVKPFDDVVFNEAVGLHPKPVKTQFGYHVIETLSRQ